MLHTVPINLPGHPYRVLVGENILENAGESISALHPKGSRCTVVTDTNVGPLYAQTVIDSLEKRGFKPFPITVPAGEPSKSMQTVEDVCRQMIDAGLDRHSFLVALGGGVVGDLAGFAAAIFYRGIPHVQIPTTVVSQVDSSVGGKTGVNTPEGKNLLGAFHQPALVIADTATLKSLPEREFNEGFAEIIKHAAIRDAEMVPLIEAACPEPAARSAREGKNLVPLVERNVAIKAAIVTEDEKETTGTRALLNFGHTIGHAVEASAGYGALLHGEAISLGIHAALDISTSVAGLPAADADRVRALLEAFQLPRTLEASVRPAGIIDYLSRDKKFEEGRIRFVLLRKLGEAFVSEDVTMTHIEEAIERLRG